MKKHCLGMKEECSLWEKAKEEEGEEANSAGFESPKIAIVAFAVFLFTQNSLVLFLGF